MKPLVIYHANCADGFGAAFAAWLKFGDDAEYVPMQYGQIKNVADLNSALSSANIPFGEGEVYILDFSLPKDVMDWLFAEVKRVVWLDHHKTAFEMWCGKYEKGMGHHERLINVEESWIELDDNKSGAYLAWEYFNPGTEVPMFVKHIDDYDRWQFKIDGTKAFQKALWSYAPWSFEQWKDMLLLVGFTGDEGEYNFYESGNAIPRAHDQNVQSVLAGQMDCKIKVPSFKGQNCEDSNYPYYLHTGLACNTPVHLCSDVGHELAKKSGTFGLCWRMQDDGRIKCELRSDSNYDVSAIAKAFGGGGHTRAAGFFTDLETLKGWLK